MSARMADAAGTPRAYTGVATQHKGPGYRRGRCLVAEQRGKKFLMQGAVIHALGQLPRFENVPEPTAGEGGVGVNVRAAALHPIVRARASGANFGSVNVFPLIPGIDGVGHLDDGTRVYFFAQDLLTRAQARLERLSRMVTGLLDVTRLRASALVGHPARTNLRSIVRAAVEDQRALAPGRPIRLYRPARTPILVWVDADRVHQVVTNLLTHALKYAPPDQPAGVRVRRQVGWAHVSIRDQGPGLPEEEQARIWAPAPPVARRRGRRHVQRALVCSRCPAGPVCSQP